MESWQPASSGAISEIVEELPPGQDLNGSSRFKFMLKTDQRDGKNHVYPVDDELEKVITEIHLRTSSRNLGPQNRKGPSKKPVSGRTSEVSGMSPSDDSLSLKQALRRLCISQASEMAALKRLSKPIGMSVVGEASTIKRLYASLIVCSNDSGLPQNRGKGVLVETSSVLERITMNSSKEKAEDLCVDNVASSSESAMSQIQDMNSSVSNSRCEYSSNEPGKDSKTRVNSKAFTSMTSSSARRTKPSIHARLIKSAIRNSDVQRKKVKDDQDPTARSSHKSSGGNAIVTVYGERNLPVLEEPDPTETCSRTPNNEVHVKDVDDSLGKLEFSPSVHRPRTEKDVRLAVIQRVLLQQGSLGLKNFKLLHKLGCGDIGIVYLAELIGSECLFALKVMNNATLFRQKKVLRAQTEKEILQTLDHPFLPTLYAYFVSDNCSCLVMEYCPGGNLHKLRQKQQGRIFTEAAARFYVAEVLLALEYLHMVGVVYRDLKPENVLVQDDGHIMLSDFDLSMRCTVSPTFMRSTSSGTRDSIKKLLRRCSELSCIDPVCSYPSRGVQVSCIAPQLLVSRRHKHNLSIHFEPTEARSYSFVGTHDYLAPEIIRGEGHGSAVDWWMLGIFLYELLYGKTPFKGANNEETLANIISQTLRFPHDLPSISSDARDLLSSLLTKDPDKRLGAVRGAAEIKQHPFFHGLNWALIRCAKPPEIPKDCKSGTPVEMEGAETEFQFF